jgi:hypothetical protein
VTDTLKHQLRADDYNARADAASEAAQDSSLPRVRERYEAAATTWRTLAEAEEDWLLRSEARRRRADAECPD